MINILPYQNKKSVRTLRALRIVTTTVATFLILIGVAALLLIPLLITINSRFAIADAQIKELEKSGIIISPINVSTIETRANMLVAKLALPLPLPPTAYITTLTSIPRPGITLSGFSMSNAQTSTVEVAGFAATRERLQQFILLLENNDRIEKVESPVSNFVKSTNSPFSIVVTFKN